MPHAIAPFDRLLCGSQVVITDYHQVLFSLGICDFRPGSGRLAAIRGIPQREPHFLDYPFYRNIWTIVSRDLCLRDRFKNLPVVEPSRNVLSSQIILMRCGRCRYLRGSPQFILALRFQYTMHPLSQLPGHRNDCHSGPRLL